MTVSTEELHLPEMPVKDYQLAPNEIVYAALKGRAGLDSAAAHTIYGINQTPMAELRLASQAFGIFDVRADDTLSADLLVASELYATSKGRRGYKGLRLNEPVTLGRGSYTDRFDYDDRVSKEHVRLAYTALGLCVQNLRPTNWTRLSADIADPYRPVPVSPIRDMYTQNCEQDRRNDHNYGPADTVAPYGYYRNHPIIGRGSQSVRGGVYFTTKPMSEAVVVDEKSQAVRRVSGQFMNDIKREYGKSPTMQENVTGMLQKVERFTASTLPYSKAVAERIGSPYKANNGLVGLSDYLQHQGGVCRHQCLLAAHLIESLIDNGYLIGGVAVERNHDTEVNGAHAWAVFKGLHGQEVIVDPAQHYVGSRQQALREKRWKYQLRQLS